MRTKRIHQPNTLVHVISRLVDDEYYFNLPGARAQCLRRMGAALRESDWKLLAYALMSDHLHWAMLVGFDTAERIFKSLNTGLAGWINDKRGIGGPVFRGRPKILEVPRARFGYVAAYLHNNPVRAEVAGLAGDSSWTSHRAYLGHKPGLRALQVDLGLSLAGFDTSHDGRVGFDEMVAARAGDARDPQLSGDKLPQLLADARAESAGPVSILDGRVGHDGQLFSLTEHDALIPTRAHADLTLPEVLFAVERLTGVEPGVLQSRTRAREVTRARALALVVWTRFCGRPQAPMARALGISDSAATQLNGRWAAGLWDLAASICGRS